MKAIEPQLTNDELQSRIDELNRRLADVPNAEDRARIEVELSQALFHQHLEKTAECLEEENRELMREFEAGKLIDFRDILNELAGIH